MQAQIPARPFGVGQPSFEFDGRVFVRWVLRSPDGHLLEPVVHARHGDLSAAWPWHAERMTSEPERTVLDLSGIPDRSPIMTTLHFMANRHFGKFADVWKHLVVDEVLEIAKPARYAETHAGSGAYAMIHDEERQYGVLGFHEDLSCSRVLSSAAFSRLTSGFVRGQPPLYPGSALQAMTLLGDQCEYLFCDMDPVSVNDLRAWSHRLSLNRCEVVQRDGMAAVREWLGDQIATVVHIDPFEPFARLEGGPTAIEMAAEVADAGHTLVYWYGFDNPNQRSWAMDEIRTLTSASLWCGDFMVTSHTHPPATDGDLGEATTPGTGCGVVLANVASPLIDRCQDLANALAPAYAERTLPNGETGHLDLAITATP